MTMGHAWGAWQWHNWRLIMLRNEARIKVKEPNTQKFAIQSKQKSSETAARS